MRTKDRGTLMLGVVTFLLIVTIVPGCQSGFVRRPAGRDGIVDPGVTPHTAYRPPYYGEPAPRPKFWGGYAGHNYGSAPREEYAPTVYQNTEPRPSILGWLHDH